ncbi:MAG: hypothetical protein QM759_13910 [Terricaulis sp.]
MTQISDDELMAFADGALDARRAAEVGAAVAADATLAAKVERLRASTAAFKGAFAGQLDVEVPAYLRAIVERGAADNVVAFKPRRTQAPLWASIAAAAACLVVGFGVGRFNSGDGLFEMRSGHALVAAHDLRGALETAASGAGVGDVRIALTFPQANAGYCRVFRIDRGDAPATAGLACKAQDDWTVVALGEAGRGVAHGGMEQAAADIPEAVLQAAADRQGGDALDANAEAQALKAHWRRR